jgi:hypothetical protein
LAVFEVGSASLGGGDETITVNEVESAAQGELMGDLIMDVLGFLVHVLVARYGLVVAPLLAFFAPDKTGGGLGTRAVHADAGGFVMDCGDVIAVGLVDDVAPTIDFTPALGKTLVLESAQLGIGIDGDCVVRYACKMTLQLGVPSFSLRVLSVGHRHLTLSPRLLGAMS